MTEEEGDDGEYDRGGERDRESDGLEKVIAPEERDGGRCACMSLEGRGGFAEPSPGLSVKKGMRRSYLFRTRDP